MLPKEIDTAFEREAQKIMIHTNPSFEKSVHEALNNIKHLLLSLI